MTNQLQQITESTVFYFDLSFAADARELRGCWGNEQHPQARTGDWWIQGGVMASISGLAQSVMSGRPRGEVITAVSWNGI